MGKYSIACSFRSKQSAMKKLEMYNFANAGHWMFQRNGAPYIENIGNHYDSVSSFFEEVRKFHH